MQQLSLLIKISLRNILRNAQRNFLTVLTISLGLGFLLFIQSVLNGHNQAMIETVTKTLTGDVQIHRKGYLEDRQTFLDFEPSGLLTEQLDSNTKAWTTRAYFPSLLSSGNISLPIVLIGIDSTKESEITDLKNNLISGEYLDSKENCENAEVLISKKLSEKSQVFLGEKLVIIGQDAVGSLGNDLFRVSGIFDSKSNDFNRTYVFTTLSCAKSIAAISGIHEIVIKTNDEFELPGDLLKETEISTWRELVPGVANMIRFNAAMSNLVTFVIFSIITIGVVNMMLMNVFERVREIGVMLAIGGTPMQVQIMILLESFFIGILGVALGSAIGFIVIVYYQHQGFDLSPFIGLDGKSAVGFNFQTLVKPIVSWSSYSKLMGLEIIFITLAGLHPAIKASQLKPVETMRG